MGITNLANTTWVFNDTMPLGDNAFFYDIVFISNNENYRGIQKAPNAITYKKAFFDIKYDVNGWRDNNYKKIKIISGDVTNSNLISFLQNNATLIELNRPSIKINGNNHPQVKILTGQTNTKRLYAKIKAKNLINFIIDGISYQAEEGMTWEDWVNSSYNTNGFYILDLVRFADDSPVCEHSSGSAPVNSSEIIISDGVYYKGSNSGGAL